MVHAEWVSGDCLSDVEALEGGGQCPRCHTLEGLWSRQYSGGPPTAYKEYIIIPYLSQSPEKLKLDTYQCIMQDFVQEGANT